MGIYSSPNVPAAHPESKQSKEEERRARKMREKIEAARGKSLVEQHTEKGTGKEKEDDPSKRAFDYEKDMAVTGTVNHKQRREMLSKSQGFSSRSRAEATYRSTLPLRSYQYTVKDSFLACTLSRLPVPRSHMPWVWPALVRLRFPRCTLNFPFHNLPNCLPHTFPQALRHIL